MAISLFSMSKSYLSNSLINKASNFLDEDSSEIKSSINGILTALYAKIIAISESKKELHKTHKLIITSHFNNLSYINLDDLFSGENSLLIDESTNFLNLLYKDQTEPLYYLISDNYNIHKESSTALVKMILPIVTGSINRVLYTEKLNANGFYQLLNEQKRYSNYIDVPESFIDGLIEKFDFKFLSEKKKVNFKNKVDFDENPNINFKFIVASLVAVSILGVTYFTLTRAFESPKKGEIIIKQDVEEIKKNTVNETYHLFSPTNKVLGKYIKDYEFLGRFVEKRLPNDVKLIVPSNSGEINLINFIENSKAPEASEWYPLRRIVSNRGTNLVSGKSTNQINNLIAILEAYPNVHLTIGGYSYSQNDPVKNFEASYRFVEEVTKEILKSNIEENRIRFEGYGDNYQLKEGPLEPKRVGVRITQK